MCTWWVNRSSNAPVSRSDPSTSVHWLWCKPAEMRENDVMPSFVPIEELFAGRHFDAEIVMLCVRWYLSFKLSYRDLVSMMSERGIKLAQALVQTRRDERT